MNKLYFLRATCGGCNLDLFVSAKDGPEAYELWLDHWKDLDLPLRKAIITALEVPGVSETAEAHPWMFIIPVTIKSGKRQNWTVDDMGARPVRDGDEEAAQAGQCIIAYDTTKEEAEGLWGLMDHKRKLEYANARR